MNGPAILFNLRYVTQPSLNGGSTQTTIGSAQPRLSAAVFAATLDLTATFLRSKHARSYLIYLNHSQTPSTALYPCTPPLLLLALVTLHCTPYLLRPSTFHLRLLHSPRVWTTSNPSDPLNYSSFLSHQLCASHSSSSMYPSWLPCTYPVNSSSP